MNILLVDDNNRIRELIRKALLAQGPDRTFYEAEDSGGAISLLNDVRIDIVILDLEMPGGNGTDVLEWLGPAEHKPVAIIFTNHHTPFYRKICSKFGAEYFLDKSFDFDRLLEIVDELCV